MGDIETRSMYMQYIQGIQPNVPASTTFIEIYRQSSVKTPSYNHGLWYVHINVTNNRHFVLV